MSAAPAFKLKFNGDRLKQYVSKLAKEGVDRVNKEMKLQIENEKFYEELEILASNIIWNEVYTKHDPLFYDRTFALYNSPVAESAGLDITKVNVVLRGEQLKRLGNIHMDGFLIIQKKALLNQAENHIGHLCRY